MYIFLVCIPFSKNKGVSITGSHVSRYQIYRIKKTIHFFLEEEVPIFNGYKVVHRLAYRKLTVTLAIYATIVYDSSMLVNADVGIATMHRPRIRI